MAGFTAAAHRVNKRFRFLPVIYLTELGTYSKHGYTFGAPYGSVLDKGSAVTMTASFGLRALEGGTMPFGSSLSDKTYFYRNTPSKREWARKF